MKKLFISIILAAFAALTTQAQWSSDPAVNTIVNDFSGSQAIPHIAYDANGNFYVGFYSNEAGNYDIRLQFYNVEGEAQWATGGILISNHPQNSWVTEWDLTTDNSGNCVMAFNDVRDGNANVYAYSISPSGVFNWGADGISLTSDPEDEFAPDVTVTSSNNVIVVWSRPTSTHNEIVMQKIAQDGTLSWGDAGLTYQAGAYSYTGPRVLGVENGNFLMAFYKESGSFPSVTRAIYVQKFDESGNTVWTNDVLASNSNGINNYNNFYIASDNNDGIVISWMDDRDNDLHIDGAVQRVLTDGTIDWPANGVEVNTTANTSNQDVRILGVDDDDNVLVTWSKKNSNQTQTAVAGQKFNASGVRQWGDDGIEFVAMSPDVSNSDGGVVFDGANSLIIYEEYVLGTTVYANVKALAVDGTGAFLWTPTTTLMSSRNTEKVHLVTSGLYNNQTIAVWEDSSPSDIIMQNIYNDGTMGAPLFSSDATLSDLTVNGTTVDGFSPNIYHYTMAIPEGDPLPITGATPNDSSATVDITQTPSVPGTSTVLVTAEDGVTQHTYTIDFHTLGTDATLSDLTVNGTTIPGFDPNVFEYDYTVANGDPIPVVGATPSDTNATTEITQATSLPGTATVLVTAEDTITTNLYTVNFLYFPGTDATLSDLTVDGETIPGFDPQIFEYDYGVVQGFAVPYIEGTSTDPLATVNDIQATNVPDTAYSIVTAEDGVTTNTYSVNFYYIDSDATLSDLTVDGVTIPGFDPNITDYQYFVADPQVIPVVDGTTTDPDAYLTVTQADSVPGDAILYVLAEDSVHDMTYTIHFYTSNTDATLQDLTVDGTTIEGFSPSVTYYEVDVPEGNDIPVIDGTPTDSLATKVVTQASTIPGDGTILVTAQDGTTQLTYTVHFNLITGLDSKSADNIKLYPNPAADYLFISGIDGNSKLNVINLLGETVLKGLISNQQRIDIQQLQKGVYFARIELANQQVRIIKFVKK